MAGSVGGAVAGCPGYAGYVPSCQQPLTTTNSGVTTRMNLVERSNCSQNIGLKGHTNLTDEEILHDPSMVFAPKRTTEKTLYASNGDRRVNKDDWSPPKTKANVLAQSLASVQAASNEHLKGFRATSTYANSFASEQNKDSQFFSTVQQIEYNDAKEDLQKTSHNTRSSARLQVPMMKKLEKRCTDSAMEPPQPTFLEGQEKRVGHKPETSRAQEYVKFLGAHVSVSSSQREYGVRGYNPSNNMPSGIADMNKSSTTADLCSGTSKSTLGLRLPGYLGHVPAGKDSAATIDRTGRPDLTKMNAQNTRIICTSRRTLPGYAGYEPKSLVNDTGRPNCPDIAQTSSGLCATAVVVSSPEEKAMNDTEFAKQGGIRKFFTQGDGQPDHSISEQYFVKFRPMEGSLKMGAPLERSIPRTK